MTLTAKHSKSVDWPDDDGTVSMFISGAWRDLLEYAVIHLPAASSILLLQRYIEIVGYTLVERGYSSYLEGPSNLMMVLHSGGIIPFEIAFNQILENPEYEDFSGYTTFRGLGRGLLWFPFRMYDYSDEFREAVKDLLADLRQKYWDKRFEAAGSAASAIDHYLQYRTDEWQG
jgi:PAS domain-containing protein